MEENSKDLTSKEVNQLFIKALKDILFNNKKVLFNTEVGVTVDTDNNFIDFNYGDLSVKDNYFRTSPNQVTLINDNVSTFSVNNIYTWAIAMLKFIKEKKLIKEFKKYYL